MYTDKVVWFGTKRYSQWITAPSVDIDAGKTGYAAGARFLNGGASVRRSKVAAKRFSFSWNMRNRDEIQMILDYADGMYGNDYLYYCNPFAMARNVFPSYWASPYQNYYDGPVVLGGIRPTLATASTSTNGYPIESAVYALSSAVAAPSIFLPVPPGYSIHLGAHGVLSSGNATVTVRPEVSAVSSGAVTNMTLLASTSSTRTNVSFSGDSYIGVTVSLASTSTGVIQLDGLIAQVLPTGTTPLPGGFISGIGQSGMEFLDQPSVSEYSAALDRVGASADLVETEAWKWR